MAAGPIQLAGIAAFRSAAPIAYANPFNGGLMSWIGDTSNEWLVVSYVLAGVILCSAVWLIDGTMTFFESRTKTAALALLLFVGVLIILVEGGKFNPFEWKELITALLFGLAFFSTCGRVFATPAKKEND